MRQSYSTQRTHGRDQHRALGQTGAGCRQLLLVTPHSPRGCREIFSTGKPEGARRPSQFRHCGFSEVSRASLWLRSRQPVHQLVRHGMTPEFIPSPGR